MTESPATIAQYVLFYPPHHLVTYFNLSREAKNIHNSLKELLKSKELFDRDVDFQRKKRVLLLLTPFHRADNTNEVFGGTT